VTRFFYSQIDLAIFNNFPYSAVRFKDDRATWMMNANEDGTTDERNSERARSTTGYEMNLGGGELFPVRPASSQRYHTRFARNRQRHLPNFSKVRFIADHPPRSRFRYPRDGILNLKTIITILIVTAYSR
jgi:hypothetical protein